MDSPVRGSRATRANTGTATRSILRRLLALVLVALAMLSLQSGAETHLAGTDAANKGAAARSSGHKRNQDRAATYSMVRQPDGADRSLPRGSMSPQEAPGRPEMSGSARSLYMRTTRRSVLQGQGCLQAREVRVSRGQLENVLVIMAFGRPMRIGNRYGASLFGDGFRDTDAIERAARAYVQGYVGCIHDSGRTRLRLALGTSNYGRQVSYRHGRAWGEMVNQANGWLSAQGAWPDVEIAGASDIELGWNGPVISKLWVKGYDSVARWPFFDFGDAGGCPPRGDCLGAWTQEDVWYVAWGAETALPLPQIYTSTGSQAEQWYRLSLYAFRHHGNRMHIAGVLSQHTACRQSSDPCWGINNSPERAWSQLWYALNRDRRTAQDLAWSTDFRWVP